MKSSCQQMALMWRYSEKPLRGDVSMGLSIHIGTWQPVYLDVLCFQCDSDWEVMVDVSFTPQVYTVGPDYAHAEARKSPALDGKVERDSEGKEVRYPVMLSAMEKLVARKVCLAFKVSQGIFVWNERCFGLDCRLNLNGVAANCVWLWPSPSQWTLLRVWRQRFQFCEKLDEVLRRLRQDPRVTVSSPKLFLIICCFGLLLFLSLFLSVPVPVGILWCVSSRLSFRFHGPFPLRRRTSLSFPPLQGPCEWQQWGMKSKRQVIHRLNQDGLGLENKGGHK